MIDPILSLAISVHSNRGVYALLLGSGVSRSALIPTGWDVVLDLIRKLAGLEGKDCEPDPAFWYKQTYGEEPCYDKLLNDVAKSQPERSRLLRSYFEPNEEEQEEGWKLPRDAHRAIAHLVKGGYIRVIVTTNFDRLVEKALEDSGITPTVIMTTDAINGALPLIHTECVVIKVNGDYMDARIKNTPEELAQYEAPLDQLLNRVFDEFGLIVCGWSAEWDVALRNAIERCPTRRFTTFWALRGSLADQAKKLIEFRQATTIQIKDADSFFRELADKVFALQDVMLPHPVSAKVAAAMVKKYVADDRDRIHLHDLVTKETEILYERLSQDQFAINVTLDKDGFQKRVAQYEVVSQPLIAMIAAGCCWGEQSHAQMWVRSLERIACPSYKWSGGITALPRLALYPGLLLLYAAGISCIAANKYETFAALVLQARCRLMGDYMPVGLGISTHDVMENLGTLLPGKERNHTPVSDHLYELLRSLLHEYLPDDRRYQETFDYFEYMLSLVYADLLNRQKGRVWAPFGRFTWRYDDNPADSPMNRIELEVQKDGDEWRILKAGLFDGSLQRFKEIKAQYDRLVAEVSKQFRFR
jgi:hypothetical protein